MKNKTHYFWWNDMIKWGSNHQKVGDGLWRCLFQVDGIDTTVPQQRGEICQLFFFLGWNMIHDETFASGKVKVGIVWIPFQVERGLVFFETGRESWKFCCRSGQPQRPKRWSSQWGPTSFQSRPGLRGPCYHRSGYSWRWRCWWPLGDWWLEPWFV